MTQDDTFQYLTAEQAADLLAVKVTTLYRWNKTGKLSPVQIGGKYGLLRYRMKDLVGLAKNNK